MFVHLGVIFFTVLLKLLFLFLQDTGGVKGEDERFFLIGKAFSTRRQLINEHTEEKNPAAVTRVQPNREL